MPGYVFTERVHRILALAREEARRRKHKSLDTGHMLLGILSDGGGVAVKALGQLGIDVAELKARVEGHLTLGAVELPDGFKVQYTVRAKKVLERAMAQSRDLHHASVGSEHLLLALLHEKVAVAAEMLLERGVTLDVAREMVVRMCDPEPVTWLLAASGAGS